MENLPLLITIAVILLLSLAVILLLLKKWLDEIKNTASSPELVAWLRSTNTRLDEQSKTILKSLQSNTHALNDRLDNAARVISQVSTRVGEITEIGRSMKNLQEFLNSPKLRGNIGEHILKELLAQVLPRETFFLQYGFKTGVIVDAAIKTQNGMIPIDSKFPLGNFRRLIEGKTTAEKETASKDFIKDVKRHVDDISRKYIHEDEGTIDYALMYVPSESVYYEIINNSGIFDYCSERRVLPVSPMTLYAYLRSILISFESQKIEKKAREILRSLSAVKKNYTNLEENLTTLSRHIVNSYNMMHQTLSSFTVLGQKIESVTPGESDKVKKLPQE